MSRAIFSTPGRLAVEMLARGSPLLAFDFDGTLAPIVRDPGRARMPATTRKLLVRLACLFPCALISGRAREDVVRRTRPVAWAEVVGNHGIECSQSLGGPPRAVQRWRGLLERELGGLAGVWVEDKIHSLSVHYRQAPNKARAKRAVVGAVQLIRGPRLVAGKDVVNVLPARAPDKGRAVQRVRRRLGCDRVLFVGDDVTDEDAFVHAGPKFLAIRVGARAGTAAPYHLSSQAQIDELLELLVVLGVTAQPRRNRTRARG